MNNTDGSLAHYTLMLPVYSAFYGSPSSGDPYFDPDLRLQVLLRHLVRQRLDVDDLAKLTSLTMASGQEYSVKHEKG